MIPYGYHGKILRVDLSQNRILEDDLDVALAEKFVGGAGFGARILWQENPDPVDWSDPRNCLVVANGPLSGTAVQGSGTICVTSKGPMTDLAGSSQANGQMGAFLKSCGYDGIILLGRADRWSYLLVTEEKAELRDATALVGKDTQETQALISKELGMEKGLSVMAVGPAAENRVRFSVIIGDGTHTASKNGLGAVLASKKIKALVVCRGKVKPRVWNPDLLKKVSKELHEKAIAYLGGSRHTWGTNGAFSRLHSIGVLPVKNYSTNLFPEHETMDGEYVRTHFEKVGRRLCFNCGIHHNLVMKVTEGPCQGFVGEEPEYEAFAALGPLIGQTDAGTVFVLADLVDRLGLDVNETGWILGWLMDCYEQGILTIKDMDGIPMNWGNVESVRKMLQKIAHREGIGDVLADGVKRASEKMGPAAAEKAVFTRKGSTPRSHDHRGRWCELVDTCLSNTSTLEATFAGSWPHLLDLPPATDLFSPWEVPTINAMINGWHIFEDCLGVCCFNLNYPKIVTEAFNAATNRNLSLMDLREIGVRVVNTLRMFNLRNGLIPEMEAPSARYGSTPVDGPAKGFAILPHWDTVREVYYRMMGWDAKTGKPTPETLRKLGLEDLVPDKGV
jgi:aldehyde:ferredoxin oxidoreductase